MKWELKTEEWGKAGPPACGGSCLAKGSGAGDKK